MNTAVLISGGVDSGVVVHQLCEQGIKPDLHYIKIGMEGEDYSCSAEEDIELCRATARKYDLQLEVTDLQKEYWERVVSYTMERVKRGLTPNPDVMCNRLIKFGAFEEQVGKHYDKVATGHYATTIEDPDGTIWLGTAKDPIKDQTDFLAQLSYEQLRHTIFPIGHLPKEEVRRIAREAHLPSARRKDSQGICFLGKINYNDFLRRFLGEQEGRIIDIETGKVLGRHRGYWFHTIGQRKGLGLSGGPWFVVKKNIKRNIVFVARGWDTQLQYGHDFRLADLHFITRNPWEQTDAHDHTEGIHPIQFKIRHVDHFMSGTIEWIDEDSDAEPNGYWHIHSDAPIQGIAPGQFGCIYSSDARICYGSGEIGI
ncbi:MAG: tRNA 2-thiouridine(34) synthase MnmA [Bacteroidales bacterium]|nr:tRNA 2-thiouridine(34) synthase MnmA [Candidatus Physcousia equi]